MSHYAQRKLPLHASRPAYRTLQGWALGKLIEQGAVKECEDHGHCVDSADPEAWNRLAKRLGGTRILCATPEACTGAMDEIMRSMGDSCPDC
jgi:hypothetical protein